jgi:crotonobetainyl-CoA:carnitine CoA-transferase CaiB-like acyl-CoA transferase
MTVEPASTHDRAAAGPLDGVTILDLTRVLSGPYCTMLLADMGARVIKVEQRGRGDDTRAWGPPFVSGESVYFLSVNRNKESVELDLKHPRARPLLEGLLRRADVLVENFRPGTLAHVGLAYGQIADRFPRLIYCSISGYGQDGPKRDLPGYDAVMQAEGGLMSITGPGDGPPYRLGVAVADIVAGMFAAQGILLALVARERSGRGQQVDVAMLDSVAALLTYQASIYFATRQPPRRMGNRHPMIVPYETFAASDGDFVVAVGNDAQWRAFCGAVGLPELAKDQRFATNAQRVTAYDELAPLLARHLRTRPCREWIEVLTRVGVPCGSVRDLDEVLGDPQLAARAMVERLEHAVAGAIEVLGVPVKLSATPGRVRTAPPVLGQDTARVLAADLGLSEGAIHELRRAGVVG